MVVIVNARRDDIPLCLRYPSHERQITVNTNAIALRVGWIRVGMHAVSEKYCIPRIRSANIHTYIYKQSDTVDCFNIDELNL